MRALCDAAAMAVVLSGGDRVLRALGGSRDPRVRRADAHLSRLIDAVAGADADGDGAEAGPQTEEYLAGTLDLARDHTGDLNRINGVAFEPARRI